MASCQPGQLIPFFSKSRKLSALFFMLFLFIHSGYPEDRDFRVVRIHAVADDEYRRGEGWREEISRLVASASMVLERSFGIRLKIEVFGTWRSDNSHLSLLELLNDLQRSVFPSNSDVVLGLTSQNHLDPGLNGVASYLHGYVLLRQNPAFSLMRMTFLHEIGHLFGAADLSETGSIMSLTNRDVRFDDFTKRAIALNKQRRFNPSLFPLAEDKLDQAEALYKGRIQSHPVEPDSYVFLALIDLEKKNHERVISGCQEAARLNPRLPEVFNLLGIAYRRSGRFNLAIEAYRRALEIQEDLPEVHYNLGIAFMKSGMIEEAFEEYRTAVSLKPRYAQAYSNLGFIHLELGQVDLALTEVRKALAIEPELAEALTTLGAVFIAQNKYREAESVSRKALEIDPCLPGIYNNLGCVAMNERRIEQAVGEYKKALEIDPSYAQAHYNLGRAYLVSGMTDESIDEFRRAISLKEDYHKAFSNLALAYLKRGDTVGALSASSQAIQIKPDYAIAFVNRGFALLLSGDLESAEAAARRAQNLDPFLAETFILYGLLGEMKGEIEAAQRDYLRALELNPNSIEAHLNSANLFYKRSLWAEAAFHYRQVISLDSRNGQVYNNLAVVSFRLHRLDDAFKFMNEAEALGYKVHPDFKSELLKKKKKVAIPPDLAF